MKHEDIKNYHDHNKWLRQEREAGRTLGGGGSSWVAQNTRQQYDNFNKALHPDPKPHTTSKPFNFPKDSYKSSSYSPGETSHQVGERSGSGSTLFWIGAVLVGLCFFGFLPLKTAITLGVAALLIALVVMVVKGVFGFVFGHLRVVGGIAIAVGIAWAYTHGYVH